MTRKQLIEALKDIAEPMRIFERDVKASRGEKRINGLGASLLCNDPHFLRDLARKAVQKAEGR